MNRQIHCSHMQGMTPLLHAMTMTQWNGCTCKYPHSHFCTAFWKTNGGHLKSTVANGFKCPWNDFSWYWCSISGEHDMPFCFLDYLLEKNIETEIQMWIENLMGKCCFLSKVWTFANESSHTKEITCLYVSNNAKATFSENYFLPVHLADCFTLFA